MRETYYERLSPTALAVLDSCDEGDFRLITRISVPIKFRSQGIGTELLRRICEDADAEGVNLLLEIVPSGGLNYDQLETWYVNFGFERIEEGEWEGYYLRRHSGHREEIDGDHLQSH